MEIRGSTIASTHPGVRILVMYISTTCAFRWRTCVRILLMHVFLMYVFWRWLHNSATYVFYRRTCSIDVHILSTHGFYRRTSSTDVRVLPTYVFYRRTSSTDVRILPAYVFYRRTHSMDIRDSATYVFCWRTYSGDGRFGTTHLEIDISGLRIRRSRIRDYASGDGFGTTLDPEYAEHSGYWIWLKKIAVDLFFRP